MILSFPEIPHCKRYEEPLTPEQQIQWKLISGERISTDDEKTLAEAVEFYKIAYDFLKSIDLSRIDEFEAGQIIRYFKRAVPMEIYSKNYIRAWNFHRVSFVKDEFLEEDKVRNIDFLKHPPLKLIRERGIFGRANSPNSTVFYCSFYPGVALMESRPSIGDRIIVCRWFCQDGQKGFMSSPISNNSSVINESLRKATQAFKDNMQANHLLFAEILNLYTSFLSDEFVKKVDIRHAKKYEYLFSGTYSDSVLTPETGIECIVYPSVANNHRSDNLAIRPDIISRLQPFSAEDCIVTAINYDSVDNPEKTLPVTLDVLRKSTAFIGARILWNDD